MSNYHSTQEEVQCLIRDLKDIDILEKRDFEKYVNHHVNQLGLICFTTRGFFLFSITTNLIVQATLLIIAGRFHR